MAKKPVDCLFRADDAANYLNFTVPTIYSKVSRRQIPFVKVNGALRFRKADLDKLIQQGFHAAQPTRRRKP